MPHQSNKLKVFDIDPAAFMLPGFKIFPLGPHLLIRLQLRIGMDCFNAVFLTGIEQADHEQRVHPPALQFRHNSAEIGIDSVEFSHCSQQMDKTKGEELPPGSLDRAGQGRHSDRKANHFIILIQHNWHQIRDYKTKVLFDICLSLFIRQINHAIKMAVSFINYLEQLRGIF